MGGTLNQGNDLQFKVGNSALISSHSNTITGDISGVTGLTVNALTTGSFNVTVGSDTTTIGNAITSFVNEYNKVQSVISTQTATTTNASGAVTAGPLTGDDATESISSSLRDILGNVSNGAAGAILSLDSLGFTSNGNDNSLSTAATAGLTSALTSNLAGLKDLFTNPSSGIAVQMASFLTDTIGNTATTGGTVTGSLVTEENTLTTQSSDITTHISAIETQVQAYQTKLTNEFVAMESAEAQTNQQASYLSKAFSSSSSG